MTPSDTLRPTMDRIQRNCLIVGVVAALAMAFGIFSDHTHALRSYLYAYIFWSGLTLGSLGIYLLHNVVGGNWGVVIRRFLESGTRTLPLMALFLVPILFGIHSLYGWSIPGAKAHEGVTHVERYLNIPFFIGRAIFYFAIWAFWGYRLVRWSHEQDRTGDPGIFFRMKSFAAPGLLIFVITVSFAFIDWIMSLEPDFYSTIYGWMFTVGETLMTFAFCIVLLCLFRNTRPLSTVLKPQHFHDISNLMLAFTMLWAYMSFAQFLIYWAENLPEEIPWYVRRFSGGWGMIAFIIAVFHFAVPFFLLLMRFIKRNPNLIYWLSIYIILMHLLDNFWIVEPSFRPRGLEIYWTDFVAPIALGGLWLAFFISNLKSRPLLPLHDPRLRGYAIESEA